MTGVARAVVPPRVRALARRWWRRDRPLPRVRVDLGARVPGWVLRVAATAATPLLVVLAGARTPVDTGILVTVALALAAWTALRPGPGPTHVAVVVAAVVLVLSPGAPFDPAALWLAPLGYAAVRLGWWAQQVGPGDLVEVTALRRTARRDLAVALATLAVGALSWAVAGRPVDGLVALAAVALVAVAWLVVGGHDGE